MPEGDKMFKIPGLSRNDSEAGKFVEVDAAHLGEQASEPVRTTTLIIEALCQQHLSLVSAIAQAETIRTRLYGPIPEDEESTKKKPEPTCEVDRIVGLLSENNRLSRYLEVILKELDKT